MFKEMEYIYAVYQERSFSKAAKKLFVSQPALSMTIKKVESEINCQIFERSTNPIGLTPAGKFYIESIEQILAIQQNMKEYFEKLSQQERGTINIGSNTYCCTYVLPAIIDKFKARYPEVDVNLIESPSLELIEKVKNDSLHLMLDAGSTNESSFDEIPFERENIILAVPAGCQVNQHLTDCQLPFSTVESGEYLDPAYPAVPLKHFAQESFLFLKKGNDMFTRGMAICKNAGFTPQISMYVDQMLTAYYLACENWGIAFVRDSIVQHVEKTHRVCLYKINDPLSVRTLTFSYKNYSALPQVTRNFINYLKQERQIL